MKSQEIAQRWYDYFAARGHTALPSASLVSPEPSLLFTIAGMVPFIPYFTGVQTAPYDRAVSVQKCIRTEDIEEVGKTARHGTFFQMCGNFSFGDYFNETAIPMAWELMTSPTEPETPDGVRGFGLDPQRLWVTVYDHDDDAYAIWRDDVGIPENRIQRMGAEDNYWHTGQPGPGGPCSEIYYDRGPAYGVEGGPVVNETRYIEIWNLVFMQYQLSAVHSKSSFEVAGPLEKKNIDTGLGLERLAMILQSVENMYETDQVRPVLDRAAELAGVRYTSTEDPADPQHAKDVRLRMVADHVRSSLMLIGDGVRPGNEGGGYILRRLIRRVILGMRLLGVNQPVFGDLITVSQEAMKGVYPELQERFDAIHQVAVREEKAFFRTIESGSTRLDQVVKQAKSTSNMLSGADAFSLHDTYGFPIDLTLEMAAEAGVGVDQDTFRELMNEQRERARADARGKKFGHTPIDVYRELLADEPTEFLGYTDFTAETIVRGLQRNGELVVSANQGDDVEIVLDETPFYAEAGGQAPDTGTISGNGFHVRIADVQSPIAGLIVHRGTVTSGEIVTGSAATASIDVQRRLDAQKAHSATHIIHAALHDVLGPQAQQAGSFNREGYMRFDFSHDAAVSSSAQSEIEDIANRAIGQNLEVSSSTMSLTEAEALGATMLFSEKYGDRVRVVEIDGAWSRELCGGTHVNQTSEIATLALTSESSVGSGNRRLEAFVGLDAFRHFAVERSLLNQLTTMLKVPANEVPARIESTLEKLKSTERQLESLKAQQLSASAATLTQQAQEISGVQVVCTQAPEVSGDDLRTLAADIRSRFGHQPAAVALISAFNGRPLVVVALSDHARERGLHAGDLVKGACGVLGGGGGGKADFAQGGGSDTSSIPGAINSLEQHINAVLQQS